MNNPIVNLLFIAVMTMSFGIFVAACDESKSEAEVDTGYSDAACDACGIYDDTQEPDARIEDVQPELSERERDEVRVEITRNNADLASEFVKITAFGIVSDILDEE